MRSKPVRLWRILVLYHRKIPKLSQGLIFFKGPFWGAYIRREIYVWKSTGLAYSWKEIYATNLQKVFTETRLEDVDLSKTQPCIWNDEIQAISELRKQLQQYTMTLFDCNHLAHVIVLWQMQKFTCFCTVFALLYFGGKGTLIWRGRLFQIISLRRGANSMRSLIGSWELIRAFTVVYAQTWERLILKNPMSHLKSHFRFHRSRGYLSTPLCKNSISCINIVS